MRGARSARRMVIVLAVTLASGPTALTADAGAAGRHHHHRHRHRHRHRGRHRASGTPAPVPTPAPAFPARTGVDEGEYYVRPTHATVAAGSVEFDPVNLGMDEHDLAVRTAQGQVLGTVVVQPGQTQTMALSLAPGTYTLFCSLYDHERLGMHSTLTVH